MNAVETLKLIGRPNAYYPNLAKPLSGVNSAVLFSQLFYWQDKATSDLGVYKTRDELEEETGLTHNEQRTAIKKLVDLGVLVVTEKRLDHKTFYKINNEKVNTILSNFANSNNETPPPKESECPEVDNVEIGETTNQSSLDQEITTKTTTEITSKEKIFKKEISSKSVKTSFPENLTVNESNQKLANELGLNAAFEFSKFRDRNLAVGGKYINWDSAFSGWLRKAYEFKQGGKKPSATVQSKQSGMTAERQREYDQYLFINGLT